MISVGMLKLIRNIFSVILKPIAKNLQKKKMKDLELMLGGPADTQKGNFAKAEQNSIGKMERNNYKK